MMISLNEVLCHVFCDTGFGLGYSIAIQCACQNGCRSLGVWMPSCPSTVSWSEWQLNHRIICLVSLAPLFCNWLLQIVVCVLSYSKSHLSLPTLPPKFFCPKTLAQSFAIQGKQKLKIQYLATSYTGISLVVNLYIEIECLWFKFQVWLRGLQTLFCI